MARAQTTAERRQDELVDATRRLFDERGVQDAPIADVAREAGIDKALVYRSFSSKEELFVLTVTHYLHELAAVGDEGPAAASPEERLRLVLDRYTGFCLRYPAFLDCAQSLMREPLGELQGRVSEGVVLRLGRSMALCLGVLEDALTALGIPEPDFLANRLYTHVIGTMHLARVGVGVRRGASGTPDAFAIAPEAVRAACVEDVLAVVEGARRRALGVADH